MPWPDEWFTWAESDPNPYVASRTAFDIAVSAVQDKRNITPVRTRNGPDFACCGEGILGYFDNRLWSQVFMVYSDRFDLHSGSAGDRDRWHFSVDRDGKAEVSVWAWGPEFQNLHWDATYHDLGDAHFLTGYMKSPVGTWHLAMSIDTTDLRPQA